VRKKHFGCSQLCESATTASKSTIMTSAIRLPWRTLMRSVVSWKCQSYKLICLDAKQLQPNPLAPASLLLKAQPPNPSRPAFSSRYATKTAYARSRDNYETYRLTHPQRTSLEHSKCGKCRGIVCSPSILQISSTSLTQDQLNCQTGTSKVWNLHHSINSDSHTHSSPSLDIETPVAAYVPTQDFQDYSDLE